jgi:flagellar biosynthesis/type III secretory pathway protein FliH
MGRRELLEALEREGQKTMAAIAGRCAAEEGLLRSKAEDRREGMRLEHEQQRELLCSDRHRTLIATAAREASMIRLRAEHTLAQRLHEWARISLKQLRRDDAERLFRTLAAELPAVPWHTLWVNPDDTILASGQFPDATVIPDETLAGGLKVATADGSLTVDNTLEVRLETSWPDLLPHLMAELRGRPA